MTEFERLLRDELAALLGVDPTSLRTDAPFDNLGVDSVIGLRLARKLEDLSGLPVDFEWVFDYPTLGQLAAFVETQKARPAAA